MQELDEFAAKTFDVEGVARDEMIEALHHLRRTGERIDAAPRGFRLASLGVDFARRLAAADGTDLRHLVGFGPLGPTLQNHAYQSREHVAGALHHHCVTDANILA